MSPIVFFVCVSPIVTEPADVSQTYSDGISFFFLIGLEIVF